MFGNSKTYFADSPVIINISNLEWPAAPNQSPFTVVRLEVIYDSNVVGEFRADTGNDTEISFDISSALRAIWDDYDFDTELSYAQQTVGGTNKTFTREYREYSLKVYTEYINSELGFTVTDSGTFTGGKCLIGGMTELERSQISNISNADISSLEQSNGRNGDASTKPTSSPEMVGSSSITSWVDVDGSGTTSKFYVASQTPAADSWQGHAPMVVRDTVPYIDFIFVNRRGAVETCSAQMKDALGISVDSKQYAKVGAPSFIPQRSLMAIATGGRRSWAMSSGYQVREWAEWWTLEFLMAKRCWMLYNGKFMPVTVEPAKKSTTIYDHTKQQMASVDFTVTLALEG